MNKLALLFLLIPAAAFGQATAGLPPPSTVATHVTCTTGCAISPSGSGTIHATVADTATTATTATNVQAGALGGVPYQAGSSSTLFVASPTTSGHTFSLVWQPLGSQIAPVTLDITPPASGDIVLSGGSSSPPTGIAPVNGDVAYGSGGAWGASSLATLLASPPTIGGTAAAPATFTNLTVTGTCTGCTGSAFITSLTTTGTSGASTVTSGVLNIPQYAPTWPTSQDLVISNGTNTPAGLAPVNGDVVIGSAGTWTAGAPFTLTTTGTSGNATFSGGTLNIPNYTAGAAFITSLTTSGSSGAATVSGGVLNVPVYSSGGGGGVSTLNAQSGTVNVVRGTQNIALPGSSGNVRIPTDFLQVDAINDLGLDNTCTNDVEAKLAAYIASGIPAHGVKIIFDPGCYLFSSQWTINATSSTLGGIYLYGTIPAAQQGTSAITFQSACSSGPDIIQYNNTTAGTQQFYGLITENIGFHDSSGSGACRSGLHIVATNNTLERSLAFTDFPGQEYSTGTGSVSNGSTTVSGSGTGWTATMRGPNALWCQAGFCQEILSVNSATSITLVSQWQFPTQTAQPYDISYNGVGLLFDGGTAGSGTNFAQYGDYYEVTGTGTRFTVATVGSPVSTFGVSRINGYGGWTNCGHSPQINHSGYSFWGDFTDTMTLFGTKENNCTWFSLVETAQKNEWIGVRGENSTPYPPNSTCPGSPSIGCSRGIELNSDRTNGATANVIIGSYLYNMGNAIQIDSDNVLRTEIAFNQLPSGVNTNNYAFLTSGAGKTSTHIDEWDLLQETATSGTLNGSSICTTANGACSGSGAVSSVTNSDGTLTVSPTTGAVVGSLNLAHANTWAAAITAPSFKTNGAGAGQISPTPTTVSSLPAASSVPAGTMIIVSDDTTLSVGTCVGGGSNYMIAVSSGSAWSCH